MVILRSEAGAQGSASGMSHRRTPKLPLGKLIQTLDLIEHAFVSFVRNR